VFGEVVSEDFIKLVATMLRAADLKKIFLKWQVEQMAF
jgi:hypothetical protein